jgi:hypothetical protein
VGGAYAVLGYPKYLVIDANGVIRLRTHEIAYVEPAIKESLKTLKAIEK